DCIAALYQSLGLSDGAEFSAEDVSLLYLKVCHAPSSTSEAHAAMKKIAGGDSSWSCTGRNVLDVLLEMERERERKEMEYRDRARKTRRLKKAAKQCWVRLASQGVQSILPSHSQDQRFGTGDQAWGYVSLSDILLLVAFKYDVVTHLLYTEMLQEHYTEHVWDTLLPWQQYMEVEVLEDLAEEALESVDMLRLAMLPGAFRIYKSCLDTSLKSCADFGEQSWSAVSFLNDLHTFRQQEQNTLSAMCQRMQGDTLKLLFLYIWLATLRAQREKMSYGALLAARQSWDTWPQVVAPCRAELAALLLHGQKEEEEKGGKDDFVTPQQDAVIVLLVLSQELERKHLVKLIHEVSLEDLEVSGCTMPPDDVSEQEAMKASCIKRLREINTWQKTQQGSSTPSKQTNSQTQMLGKGSQIQLGDGALLLLTHLMELQEVQASALLEALVDGNSQRIQGLRDKYEDEIKAARFPSLLHLLTSDPSPTSCPMLIPNLNENSTTEPRMCQTENGRSAEATAADSNKKAGVVMNEVQTADGLDRHDVCSGCGAVIEDLPYLEILCAPDAQGDAHDGLSAEGDPTEEEEGSVTNTSQSCQKQGSLITLAWSKRLETEAEPQRQDGESRRNQIQSTECEQTVHNRDGEELNSRAHHDSPSADQQNKAIEQMILNKRPNGDQSNEKEDSSKSDQVSMVADSLQNVQQHPVADSSEHAGHPCSETSNHTAPNEMPEVEMCPTEAKPEQWGFREPELSDREELIPCQESTVRRLLHLRECEVSGDGSLSKGAAKRVSPPMEREAVSTMEREKTMRSLVDMQRKVEQRQQRDRERQLLRVQERLSIIQNRKAEEDLLGLNHTDRIKQLTQDLPTEDKSQQKTVVRERLEQLRRERSYIMQSRRDRNTAGFKELLAPVTLHSSVVDEGSD
ncbi:unnamed protein product, partial [Menidia menidia]